VPLVLLLAVRAGASFHVSVIDEVATSVGGDTSQQFVEVRMLASGQTAVANSVLAAFDARGAYLGDVLVVPANVAGAGAGLRWIMATQAFQDAHAFAADFTIPPGVLPVADGMVCWGAPGTVPPDPASWSHDDPTRYVDCVAYGRFCGASPGGAPVAATPADHSLVREGTARFTNADFACSPTLTPRNNDGSEIALAGAPCAPLDAFLCGRALRGGPPAATDCLGVWVVAGARTAAAVVRCKDGDPACDQGTNPGCFLRAQLCFGLGRGLFPGAASCTGRPVGRFTLRGGTRGSTTEVTDALAALGGKVAAAVVTFDPPVPPGTCTAPFDLLVPLVREGGRLRRGSLTFHSVTRAGRVDHDTVRFLCVP
jgi:hypothetical protein